MHVSPTDAEELNYSYYTFFALGSIPKLAPPKFYVTPWEKYKLFWSVDLSNTEGILNIAEYWTPNHGVIGMGFFFTSRVNLDH